ncbi:hypothetical protein LAZ40_06055 [Cereibacter sphaeroides]|uniref:hypothetical protein n=1 Tax=Rhodobacterales TaxID=204455 RepID=UPI0012FD7B6B|nr:MULTISPECIES: hypothetical protein [Paracoccaceae]MCE6951134.1 hypothetical protein [Cereibacter sphaeroides]MCE6958612.1 hypothetical protein [Cereibacter sphaeroides]MCE6968955.1 hypothetical protein [Cereibacter sphaeroides]MCE6972345.1 hypothetical protein [Cereibacter sphaeroides]
MRINFISWADGIRLAWPFFLGTLPHPRGAAKSPKILTREELRELFSSELSHAGQGGQSRQRPVGMPDRTRLPA